MHNPVQLSTAQHNGNFMYIVGGQRRGSYSRHVLGSIWGFDQVGCPGQERRVRHSIQFIHFFLSLDTSKSSLPWQVPTSLCPAPSNFSLRTLLSMTVPCHAAQDCLLPWSELAVLVAANEDLAPGIQLLLLLLLLLCHNRDLLLQEGSCWLQSTEHGGPSEARLRHCWVMDSLRDWNWLYWACHSGPSRRLPVSWSPLQLSW